MLRLLVSMRLLEKSEASPQTLLYAYRVISEETLGRG